MGLRSPNGGLDQPVSRFAYQELRAKREVTALKIDDTKRQGNRGSQQ